MDRDSKKSLGSEERFVAFLKEAARSEQFQEMRRKVEEGPHVPESILEDYVKDRLDDEETGLVMDHVAFCSKCARKLTRIRETLPLSSQEEATEEWDEIEQVLLSEEGFEAFLRSLAHTAPTDVGEEIAAAGPHPTEEEIRDYVDGVLSEDQESDIMDHLAECPGCLTNVSKVRDGARESEPFWTRLRDALESDDSLEAFLGDLCPDSEEVRIQIRPSQEVIIRYVCGELDEDEDRLNYVMDCISSIPQVANEVAYLRLREAAAVGVRAAASVHIAAIDERIKRIDGKFDEHVTPPLMLKAAVLEEAQSWVADAPGPRLTVERVTDKPILPGEMMEIRITAEREGHVWIFHADAEGEYHVETVFPRSEDVQSFLAAGVPRNILVNAGDNPGDFFLRAVWTPHQVVDPPADDLGNRFMVQEWTEGYLDRLRELPHLDGGGGDLTFTVED
ncbi:MAG: zf-HC2 domain-containing protein [Pseudomonadota bacterium]